MKFALVGVGSAGGRIVDQLREYESKTGRTYSGDNAIVFDTDRSAFKAYDNVPLDHHVLVGDTHRDIRGEGVEGDLDLGATVAREDVEEIHREFDKLALHELDAVLVVAGLGGGTGGGVGAVVLEDLASITDNPVYAVGVLPHSSESDLTAVNAARSLQSFVQHADNVLLFDNDSWYTSSRDHPLEENYGRMNEALATRLSMVLGTGELESGIVAESMVDTSDVMKTLETGGVSAIGYASFELEDNSIVNRILSLFRNGDEPEDTRTDAMRTKDLIQEAATSQLTLPCSISSADRVLIVLSGKPEACSRKGFESGRNWVEQESDTVETFAGDEPRPDATTISVAILFSNVTDVPRIDRLQDRALAVSKEDPTQADQRPTAQSEPKQRNQSQTDGHNRGRQSKPPQSGRSDGS